MLRKCRYAVHVKKKTVNDIARYRQQFTMAMFKGNIRFGVSTYLSTSFFFRPGILAFCS